MKFLFDGKKYFNKSVGTQFLPIARLHNVAIFRWTVATEIGFASFSVTVPT